MRKVDSAEFALLMTNTTPTKFGSKIIQGASPSNTIEKIKQLQQILSSKEQQILQLNNDLKRQTITKAGYLLQQYEKHALSKPAYLHFSALKQAETPNVNKFLQVNGLEQDFRVFEILKEEKAHSQYLDIVNNYLESTLSVLNVSQQLNCMANSQVVQLDQIQQIALPYLLELTKINVEKLLSMCQIYGVTLQTLIINQMPKLIDKLSGQLFVEAQKEFWSSKESMNNTTEILGCFSADFEVEVSWVMLVKRLLSLDPNK